MKNKNKSTCSKKSYKKKNIPKAIREQCWIQSFGKECFEHKCHVEWCENIINTFDFNVGLDKPESKGGTFDIENIKPICARCNLSMSDNYTISEWNELSNNKEIHLNEKNSKKCINCFIPI